MGENCNGSEFIIKWIRESFPESSLPCNNVTAQMLHIQEWRKWCLLIYFLSNKAKDPRLGQVDVESFDIQSSPPSSELSSSLALKNERMSSQSCLSKRFLYPTKWSAPLDLTKARLDSLGASFLQPLTHLDRARTNQQSECKHDRLKEVE